MRTKSISQKQSTNAGTAAGSTAIRPFRIDVPQAEVDELRRRGQATRWPERETVTDRSQGRFANTFQRLRAALSPQSMGRIGEWATELAETQGVRYPSPP
jgi:hypothetical protein